VGCLEALDVKLPEAEVQVNIACCPAGADFKSAAVRHQHVVFHRGAHLLGKQCIAGVQLACLHLVSRTHPTRCQTRLLATLSYMHLDAGQRCH
jgi:hypothetical protein